MRIVNETGAGKDTQILATYGGQEVDISRGIRGVKVDVESPGHRVVATVEVVVGRVDMIADETRWVGLEDVPYEALKAEIDRREAEYFTAAAGLD